MSISAGLSIRIGVTPVAYSGKTIISLPLPGSITILSPGKAYSKSSPSPPSSISSSPRAMSTSSPANPNIVLCYVGFEISLSAVSLPSRVNSPSSAYYSHLSFGVKQRSGKPIGTIRQSSKTPGLVKLALKS